MAFHNVPPNGFPDLPDMEELEAVEKDLAGVKASVAGLAEDVSNLNDTKANQITIAPSFSAETPYEVGDLIYYNGLTYRCTNDHEGEWDADDFAATTVSNELYTLKSGLTNVDVALSVQQYAGRNLLPMTLASIKAASTEGTWADNVYTINNVTYTVNTDTDGNVTDIVANGTASENALLGLASSVNLIEGTIINGSVGGSTSAGGYGIGLSGFGIVAPDGDKVITSQYAAAARNVYIRVSKDGVVTNQSFTPMIRLASITDPTFAPYIPSVESRIEAVESGLTNLTANRSGNHVNLKSYTSSNMYTIPKDGYIVVNSDTDSTGNNRVVVRDSIDSSSVANIYQNVTGTYQIESLFVKTGLKVYVNTSTANSSIEYAPLSN